MLVISRKESEQIVVGDVTITVVRTGTFQVRLGIDAPREIPIYRVDADGNQESFPKETPHASVSQ